MTTFPGPLTAAIERSAWPRRERRGHRPRARRRRPSRRRAAVPASDGRERRRARRPSSETEHAGHARGDVLADAVAHHARRPMPHAAHNVGQRVLEGEQRRLGVPRVIERRVRRSAGNSTSKQRPVEVRATARRRTGRASRGTAGASRTARAPSRRTGRPGPVNRNATSRALP